MRAPIATEHLAQVDDLRLAGDVVDHRGAVGQHRRHHQVLGRPDRGEVQPQVGADAGPPAPRRRPARARCVRRPRAPAARGCACPARASRSRRHRAGPRWPGDTGRRAGPARRSMPGGGVRARRGPCGPAPPAPRSSPGPRSDSLVGSASVGVDDVDGAAELAQQLAHHRDVEDVGHVVDHRCGPGPAARPPSASARSSWRRRRAPSRASGRVSGPSETTRKLPMRVTLVTRCDPAASCRAPTLGWGHGQPHPHLHAHRRRRQDPPRRHERDHQDRPAAAGVRRRRRDQRAHRRSCWPPASSTTTWPRCSPTCRTTSSTSARTSARRSWRTRSTRRCGSRPTTSTGSRAGATSTTRSCPSCARSSSTAAPRPRRTCTSPAPSCRRAERSAWAAHAEYADTMNVLAIKYLNRLSDLLFILARHANRENGDVLWVPGGERGGPSGEGTDSFGAAACVGSLRRQRR